MKLIKRLFYTICILIMLGCAGVVICALNPKLTESLATIVNQGMENPDSNIGSLEWQLPENTEGLLGIQPIPADNPVNWDNKTDEEYKLPADENVSAPSDLYNRNGYEPLKEEEQQIADNEANRLKEQLDTGELGEGLDFDSGLYPYYAMLDGDMKSLYKQIYANAANRAGSFAPAVSVNTNQLKNVFEALFDDHPELFWMETGYTCKHTKDGSCVEIGLKYYPLANNLAGARTVFESEAQTIVKGAQALSNNYEKEKYVHDALLSKVEYDARAEMNQSAYSAIVNGRTVCAGYARAFQYIMQQLGIPAYYCTGYSGEDHAWNIVWLSDGYYNVDVTWDDTEPSTYNYFNKTDADYAATHVRKGLSVYLPACNAVSFANLTNGAPGAVEIPENTGETIAEKPMKPLTWEKVERDVSGNEIGKTPDVLKQAGINLSDVITTLDDYYNSCETKLVDVGSGDKQFINVVTDVEWIVIEQEYLSGRYMQGYVESALKKLGMEHFSITIQSERLGSGYYRLYHNVVTW